MGYLPNLKELNTMWILDKNPKLIFGGLERDSIEINKCNLDVGTYHRGILAHAHEVDIDELAIKLCTSIRPNCASIRYYPEKDIFVKVLSQFLSEKTEG